VSTDPQPRPIYPLAELRGEIPPRPDWFTWAIGERPERRYFPVHGAQIELLTWGSCKGPGLLFLHGGTAHADWWSPIAPFFAAEFRCSAISWSGMGGSEHRDRYSIELLAEECLTAIDAAGLGGAETPPILIAHSFGGYPALHAGALDSRIGGIVLVDTALIPRAPEARAPSPIGGRPHTLFPTLEEALCRFRLVPPHHTDLRYVIDFIARRSLREDQGFWSWKFDPMFFSKIDRIEVASSVAGIRCPVAYLRGDVSSLARTEDLPRLRHALPPNSTIISIPDAGHHIMIDQPLALIAAIRALLSNWPNRS
jgi:pimeloyl-ACP methyl ester carboxylesterase